ncbi:hypothetical protein ACLMJK_001348 [Lecanora helva]
MIWIELEKTLLQFLIDEAERDESLVDYCKLPFKPRNRSGAVKGYSHVLKIIKSLELDDFQKSMDSLLRAFPQSLWDFSGTVIDEELGRVVEHGLKGSCVNCLRDILRLASQFSQILSVEHLQMQDDTKYQFLDAWRWITERCAEYFCLIDDVESDVESDRESLFEAREFGILRM